MAEQAGASLEAIEGVYRRDGRRFLHVATAIVGDAERAADAVHDAFASAIRHRASFRSEGPLEAWLWRAVVHASRRESGRVRRQERVSLDASRVSTNGSAAAGEIRTVVAALPERQRYALFLRYYADLDYAAIAVALDMSIGTVGSTLAAARAALRPLIEEATHEPT